MVGANRIPRQARRTRGAVVVQAWCAKRRARRMGQPKAANPGVLARLQAAAAMERPAHPHWPSGPNRHRVATSGDDPLLQHVRSSDSYRNRRARWPDPLRARGRLPVISWARRGRLQDRAYLLLQIARVHGGRTAVPRTRQQSATGRDRNAQRSRRYACRRSSGLPRMRVRSDICPCRRGGASREGGRAPRRIRVGQEHAGCGAPAGRRDVPERRIRDHRRPRDSSTRTPGRCTFATGPPERIVCWRKS